MNNLPYIVGLTGGIGSGKSTVAETFARLGASLVDADVIARQVVAPGEPALTEIRKHFGSGVITPDGSLDRQALRERVFNDPTERQWLEEQLHPRIRQEILNQCRSAEGPYVLLVVPLLLENGAYDFVQRVVVVDVPPALQVERVQARDGSSPELIRRIMDTQLDRATRLAQADDIVDNTQSIEHMKQQVEELHERYREFARYH